MSRTTFDALLDAGVHFGHLRRKWNPAMAPYIFMERNGIHIIDLYKTMAKIDEAAAALKQIAKAGKKILFVATKKQAKEIVAEHIKRINMPYVTERWPGGMLTNFATIRKAVRKMNSIDKLMSSPSYSNLSKKERLTITRERAKLEKNLGSISDLNRLPSAIFIVDILKEHIALAEAKKLNIPTFAIVDTNSDPRTVDFPIPANDDASKSISLVVETMVRAMEEGLVERKLERDKKVSDDERGEGDEFESRMGDNLIDIDEDEVDEDGIKIVKKDFVDTKVTKMKGLETSPEEQDKPARKRISKPVGRSKK
ncbi:MAG: 30S ribosomal protein S2 [Bacteroidota bacterium]